MTPWLSFADVSCGERMNVFCFPFAAGGHFFIGDVAAAVFSPLA